jgi:hypothetical protein
MNTKPLWPILGAVLVFDVGVVILALTFPWIGYVLFGGIFLFGVVVFFYPK